MTLEVVAYFTEPLDLSSDELRESSNASSEYSANLPFCVASSEDSIVEASDEELLAQITSGTRNALATLFRRHGVSVLSTAYRILRDPSEAVDLRQDVFLYIFQKAKYFDPEKGSAVSWIIQITYHRAIDRRRYLTSRQHYKQVGVTEDRLPTLQGLPSVETIDGKALLNRMREDLSADQQMTLDLHFFEGYTFREIAEKNGQTVGNVRHHYYRALERLRSGLFPEKRA